MNHNRDSTIRTPVSTASPRAGDPSLRPAPLPARTVDSAALFRGQHEIGIEHQGSLYRLKITRQGKLILNK